MRIIKHVNHGIGDQVVVLARVDMEELNSTEFKDDQNSLLFHINTYAKLGYVGNDNEWITIFKPANEFLATLTTQEQCKLGKMFVTINKILSEQLTDTADLQVVMAGLSQIAYDTAKELGLSKKILNFVENSDIVIPDLGYVGKEPHHSNAMSFGYDGYISLTAIVIYCKMFCPIFGEIISLIKKDIDSSLKETHCIILLKLILGNDFFDISNKFYKYIESIISAKKRVTPTNTFNGYTYDKFTLVIYAAMLVKKFVNVNIYRVDGNNLVTYAVSCAKSTLGSIESNMKNRNTVMLRKDPAETTDAEGNFSRMETESCPSKAPSDVPVLAKIGTLAFINSSMDIFNIDYSKYMACVNYYENNPSAITSLNQYLICTFAGHHIGGAAGISMLDASTFMKLVAFTQLYMLNMADENDFALIHALSVIPTDTVKTQSTLIDNKIQMGKGASYAYRNCKQMFPYTIGNTSWDAKAKDIMEFITTEIHLYNTAGPIWKGMNYEPMNKSQFLYNEGIMQSLFKFIEHVLKLVEQPIRDLS